MAGFCTIYKYKKNYDKIKAQISQFLIFPKYQRCGVGTVFLHCVYNIIRRSISNLLEITIEDPNENFNVIRVINNAATIISCDYVMGKLNMANLSHKDFISAIKNTLKFNDEESEYLADVVIYITANNADNTELNRQRVISRLRDRFAREWKVN